MALELELAKMLRELAEVPGYLLRDDQTIALQCAAALERWHTLLFLPIQEGKTIAQADTRRA